MTMYRSINDELGWTGHCNMIWTWKSPYFVKVFVALFSLTQGAGSAWHSPREWIDSSASIDSIIGGGKGKTYVFAKHF